MTRTLARNKTTFEPGVETPSLTPTLTRTRTLSGTKASTASYCTRTTVKVSETSSLTTTKTPSNATTLIPSQSGTLPLSCRAHEILGVNDSDCIACGPGLISNEAQNECLPCADFEYSPSNYSVCRTCGPGHVPNFEQSECIACRYYQYSELNDSVCYACSSGHVPSVDQSGCVACQAFEVSTRNSSVCQPCGAGKVPIDTQNECLPCQHYEYSGFNASVCSACGTGQIPTNDQSECIACVPGKEYSAIEDSTCYPFLDQEFLSNQSFTVESSCDNLSVDSSCAMAGFSRVVDVAVNMVSGNSFVANSSLDEQTKFVSFLRSRDGRVPRIDSSCENNVEEDPQVFAKCNSLLPNVGLPVQPRYRVLRNSSCNHQRECRNMLLVLSLQMVPNASSLFMKHLEAVGDASMSPHRELVDITLYAYR